jgi:flagellar hook-associated protein 1
MSGLFGSLTQSIGALNAHSRGVETAGRNLANVANPHYARQRVLYGDRGTVLTPQGAQSLGIEAKAIQQVRDRLLDQQVVREMSLEASLVAQSRTYAKTQAALGESIDRSGATDITGARGLGAALGELFNAFQAFSARPTDLGERQHLLQRADAFTERVRLTEERLLQVQRDIDAEVATTVTDANRLLATIGELNAQIGRLEITAPGSAVDLRDQRQARIEELAAKFAIEIRDIAGSPGQVEVFSRDAIGQSVVLVSLAAVVRPFDFDGTGITAGGETLALNGGHISGLLTSRDGGVQSLRDQLEAFSGQVVTAINGAYNPSGTSGDFFTYTSGEVSGSLRLSPALTPANLKASAGGAAGDNTLALAVAELFHQRFSLAGGDAIEGTFAQAYSALVSDFGRVQSGVEGRLQDQSTIMHLVAQQRDAISGVSLDEEMADLLKYQRAFQASSRVVSIIDEMLDTIVNRLSRV